MFLLYVLPFLGRTIAMDESVDWRSFDLPFALLFVCSVRTFMLGWGSIPRRVWRVGTLLFGMIPSLTD